MALAVGVFSLAPNCAVVDLFHNPEKVIGRLSLDRVGADELSLEISRQTVENPR
jgi:hypothetical protein